MSVPLCWTDDGLPDGVMLSADFRRKDLLLRLTAQLESERPWFDMRPDLD
jgi:Asp-tRNA(Asn)/Glu-tRNA(Gln) amidotransferase A subunit family amidase